MGLYISLLEDCKLVIESIAKKTYLIQQDGVGNAQDNVESRTELEKAMRGLLRGLKELDDSLIV